MKPEAVEQAVIFLLGAVQRLAMHTAEIASTQQNRVNSVPAQTPQALREIGELCNQVCRSLQAGAFPSTLGEGSPELEAMSRQIGLAIDRYPEKDSDQILQVWRDVFSDGDE